MRLRGGTGDGGLGDQCRAEIFFLLFLLSSMNFKITHAILLNGRVALSTVVCCAVHCECAGGGWLFLSWHHVLFALLLLRVSGENRPNIRLYCRRKRRFIERLL